MQITTTTTKTQKKKNKHNDKLYLCIGFVPPHRLNLRNDLRAILDEVTCNRGGLRILLNRGGLTNGYPAFSTMDPYNKSFQNVF